MTTALASRVSPVPLEQQDDLARLEASIRAELQTIELPLRHFFIPGVYVREMTIPAGTVLVGKIHKHEQISILTQGDITVLTEKGLVRVQAPHVLVSPPGVKRAGYAHADTRWLTVHHYHEAPTPERVEEVLVCESFAEFERFALEQKESA